MILPDRHPSMRTIQSFCDGTLPDFEQVVLEEHFVECEQCMNAMTRWELLESGFTAELHAAALNLEARAADPLVKAIGAAVDRYGAFAAALQGWLADVRSVWGSSPGRHFGEASLLPISGTAEEDIVRVVLPPGETRGEVGLQRSRQTVEVECDARAGSLALIFLSDDATFVHASALEPKGEMQVARFTEMPAGNYRLAIGPEPAPKK